MSFYDYTLKDWQGNDFSLDACRGKVVLVVNTAQE
jgi:glutathione peroxidase-family protein